MFSNPVCTYRGYPWRDPWCATQAQPLTGVSFLTLLLGLSHHLNSFDKQKVLASMASKQYQKAASKDWDWPRIPLCGGAPGNSTVIHRSISHTFVYKPHLGYSFGLYALSISLGLVWLCRELTPYPVQHFRGA